MFGQNIAISTIVSVVNPKKAGTIIVLFDSFFFFSLLQTRKSLLRAPAMLVTPWPTFTVLVKAMFGRLHKAHTTSNPTAT